MGRIRLSSLCIAGFYVLVTAGAWYILPAFLHALIGTGPQPALVQVLAKAPRLFVVSIGAFAVAHSLLKDFFSQTPWINRILLVLAIGIILWVGVRLIVPLGAKLVNF